MDYEKLIYTIWNGSNRLWSEQEEFLEVTSKEIVVDDKGDKLIAEIHCQIYKIKEKGFEPEFILMNVRNYERLIAWLYVNHYMTTPPDDFYGLKLVVWDVPVDYVNVICSASKEWSYGEGIHK